MWQVTGDTDFLLPYFISIFLALVQLSILSPPPPNKIMQKSSDLIQIIF